MNFYFDPYREAYRLRQLYSDKQNLLNEMYNNIGKIREVYLTLNSNVESLSKSIDEFNVNFGNTSAMNKLDKASDLLASANSDYSMAKYICQLNNYLHPMADDILSEDTSTSILKQNYMAISFTIQYNCNQAGKTIVKRMEEVVQKAQVLYNRVLNEYNKEYSY